jgi:tetraacyldisaccharide 4'-kinase
VFNNDTLKNLQKKMYWRIWAIPFSYLYFFVIFLRNFFYDLNILKVNRLDGFCISVGNIHVGGSGKTPVVIEIASVLQQKGFCPAVLTRGYGSGIKGFVVVVNAKIIYSNLSKDISLPDEALLQSSYLPKTPIVISPNRYQAAQWFCKMSKSVPTHWILDDGFQHRKIKKDIDIVLIKKSNLSSNYLLPRGLLREPLSSINRANTIVFDDNLKYFSFSKFLYKKSQVVRCSFKTQWPISIVSQNLLQKREMPCTVVCGIANPQDFCTQLKDLGVVISQVFASGDHGVISQDIVNNLSPASVVIITEKDLFRDVDFWLQLKCRVFIAKLLVKFYPNNTNYFM